MPYTLCLLRGVLKIVAFCTILSVSASPIFAQSASVSITANGQTGPVLIGYDRSPRISWTSQNVSDCTVSPNNWSGVSGEGRPKRLTAPQTFIVTCSGSEGLVSDSVSVNVRRRDGSVPNLSVAISAARERIELGRSTRVNWVSSGADDCEVTPHGWTGSSGERSTWRSETQPRTYLLSCRKNRFVMTDSVTVNISSTSGTGSIEASGTYQTTTQWGVPHCTAPGKQLKLNIARPVDAEGPRPALIFVHGGGWTSGSRSKFNDLIQEAASRGLVAATIDYRLSGDLFPGQVEDVKCAIRWMRAHAEQYQIDDERIGLLGASAGGHLALMAAFTDHSDGFADRGEWRNHRSDVKAVVNWYGVADMHEQRRSLSFIKKIGFDQMFGGELTAASPVTYVDSEVPPVHTSHGTADKTVPYEQAILLKSALDQAGVHTTLESFEGVGHNLDDQTLPIATESMFSFFADWL